MISEKNRSHQLARSLASRPRSAARLSIRSGIAILLGLRKSKRWAAQVKCVSLFCGEKNGEDKYYVSTRKLVLTYSVVVETRENEILAIL